MDQQRESESILCDVCGGTGELHQIISPRPGVLFSICKACAARLLPPPGPDPTPEERQKHFEEWLAGLSSEDRAHLEENLRRFVIMVESGKSEDDIVRELVKEMLSSEDPPGQGRPD